jgi:hypothetical protein
MRQALAQAGKIDFIPRCASAMRTLAGGLMLNAISRESVFNDVCLIKHGQLCR